MAYINVQLAPDLTFEQFLRRVQPTPIKPEHHMIITPEGRVVGFIERRFADGVICLIGCEPIADRWYYRTGSKNQ